MEITGIIWEKCERPEFDPRHTCLVHLRADVLSVLSEEDIDEGFEYDWPLVFHDLRERFGEDEVALWDFPSGDFNCWDMDEDEYFLLTLEVEGSCGFCLEEGERRKAEEQRKALEQGVQGAFDL